MNAFTNPPAAPSTADPENFAAKGDAFVAWMVTHTAELNAFVIAINNLATNSSSASNLTIGSGTQVLVVDAGKSYLGGMTVILASAASPVNQMYGIVTAYDTNTGALTVEVPAGGTQGAGSFADWIITLGSVAGLSVTQADGLYLKQTGGALTGLLNQSAGVDIASAATIDLTAATGNVVNITGTVATSALTMTDGQWMLLVAAAAWPLTYHPANFNLNTGGANYTCAAGDRLLAIKNGGVVNATIIKKDGTAVVAPVVPPVAIANKFVTAETEIVSGGTGTIPHGLGAAPAMITLQVKCAAAEAGWSVGDIKAHKLGCDYNNIIYVGVEAWADAVNLYYRAAASANVLSVLHKTTGVQTPVANANWRMIFTAWL